MPRASAVAHSASMIALCASTLGSNARISAVVALSPVPNNSSFGPYPNDTVPSLIFGGQGDPLYSGFQGEYNAIPGATSKMLAIFNQAKAALDAKRDAAKKAA